eukprot:1002037-Amphidinium_carterae.1
MVEFHLVHVRELIASRTSMCFSTATNLSASRAEGLMKPIHVPTSEACPNNPWMHRLTIVISLETSRHVHMFLWCSRHYQVHEMLVAKREPNPQQVIKADPHLEHHLSLSRTEGGIRG